MKHNTIEEKVKIVDEAARSYEGCADGDFADRAFDALNQNPNADLGDLAHRLAMEWRFA